ncbi:MAG: tetraether lipid synthase Tes [Phycisphaerae bacterium]
MGDSSATPAASTQTRRTADHRETKQSELAARRKAVRRFTRTLRDLPHETRATCPTCREVVPAGFDRAGDRIVLHYHCPRCGERREAHHDHIWTPTASDVPGSATQTCLGSRIRPVLRRLPRTVESLCPHCHALVIGRIFVEDGAVFMEKTCPEHGYIRDCVNSDALLYAKSQWWSFEEHPGHQRPHVTGGGWCPSDCGLCNQHLSSPCLAQIDVTNRCNLRCPVCFANAAVTGKLLEPDYGEVVRRLRVLRDLRPIPATAVQFTGGEPTIHPDFLRILAAARDMGFSHIQAATNGIRLADADFAEAAADAGLHTLYLQFDGVGAEAHRYTRACPGLWEKKLATIENCRRTGMKVCLVPTIIRGVNERQVGEIFRFAVENIDVVSAISYQPVAFTGRIDDQQRAEQRYTLGDLAHDIADASGAVPLRDMFPLSIVAPLGQFLEAITGNPKIRPSCHPDCAFGTYFLVSAEGRAYPFPEVVDVEGMFTDMNRFARRIKSRGRLGWFDKIRVLRMFKRHFKPESAPPGLDVKRFVRTLQGLVDKKAGRGEGEKQTYKTLLCAGMHFQDRYNFDVERVKRCVILYSTEAGVLPFCTHNCGPEYRTAIESDFADPVGSYEARITEPNE